MTERSTCLLKHRTNTLPHFTSEECVFEIKDTGFGLQFFYPAPSGNGYTQERYCYSWGENALTVLPGGRVVIIGAPEITVDNIPIVIAQGSPNCSVEKRTDLTVVVKMSDRAIAAIRDRLNRHREGHKC